MQPLLAGEPQRIGDYRILARIGGGAMGGVYLARSRGGRPVAIKVVRPELAEDSRFRERFRREVHMSAAVGGFWTAAVVDADPDADRPWLATEYVPGPTLHEAVASNGPLPAAAVLRLTAGLAEALQAVHAAGLVHRDLKPSNVLLGPDGPRVIDFGISRAMAAGSMTATGVFFGTPGYFSPEQTLGTEVGPPSDVFSLGAVLMFAATAAGPFGNENSAAMLYRVVHTEPTLDHVPEDVRPLVAACLAKDPADRPAPKVILDRIGQPGTGSQRWLPAGVTALIHHHTERMRDTVHAGTETPQAQQHPATVVEHSPSATHRGPGTAVEQPTPAEPRPDPRATARSEAVPRPVVPETAAPTPARVRDDAPGPVFRTGGRTAALVSALGMLALAYGVTQLAGAAGLAGNTRPVFVVGIACLLASAAISLLRAVGPGLRLKINGDGLVVSRMWLRREIPWQDVGRIGVVGNGKKQAVAVWTIHTAETHERTWWHQVRSYHGGRRVFPVGATGGWWARRREARRLRSALEQYASAAYDAEII